MNDHARCPAASESSQSTGADFSHTGPEGRVTLSRMTESSVVKSVRLPRELVERLDMQAKAEHRTVNNLITKILAEALNRPAPEDKATTA
jgi:hypothetical protein